jgi:3-oxoacyl-[acyl-carrier protein] reductase
MESPQIVLVTGASRGLGRAAAVALSGPNRFVYINYNSNETQARITLEMMEEKGGKGALLPFDVKDTDAALGAVKAIISDKGALDILVNNAGIRDDRLLAMMKQESWDNVLDTNLSGFYNVTKPAVKKMLARQWGRIINITSASGQVGQAGQVNYSASKAGLIGATKALAKEVAKRKITVNAVAPGFIETEMVEGMAKEDIAGAIPAGRLGTPQEVASLIAFLCSEDAAYITGQVIGINGGLC